MLEAVEAETRVRRLWPKWQENRDKSLEFQQWALGKQDLPTLPDSSPADYRELQKKAITPWLGLLVRAIGQALDCEGFTRSDTPVTGEPDGPSMWGVWQANRMDSRQIGLYEAVLTTGVAYVAVLPTSAQRVPSLRLSQGVPEWRTYSSAQMTAFYEHADDEWPRYAIAAEKIDDWQRPTLEEAWRVVLFDDTHVYRMVQTAQNSPVMEGDPVPHGMSRVPIVAYVNRRTIEGRVIGEIEPYIAAASRIDQDVFDRLMVQRFGAWRTKWATGVNPPPPPPKTGDPDQDAASVAAANRAQHMVLKVSDVLVSDSTETKFGTLEQTDLDAHLRAPLDSIRMLASVSQTPPVVFTGDISNISAEALAALDSSYNRKVEQLKRSLGESHEQVFNLSAVLMGIDPDYEAQVRWRDLEARSLSQMADAYGKLHQMLEIPVEILWDKIGLLDQQDVDRAHQLRSEGDALARLFAEFEGQEPTVEVV